MTGPQKAFCRLFLPVTLAILLAPHGLAFVAIGHVENSSVGQFLSMAGGTLSTGGDVVGYFSVAAPNTSQWSTLSSESIATAYANLTNPSGSFGFVDVRNISGATEQGGFNWNFGSAIGGTVENISISILPPNTQMYIMAFDNGTLANSFSGASSWAATTSPTNWLSPADNVTKSLLLNQVVSSGVLVGTLSGNNVLLASPVPEPSAWLSALGGAGLLVHLRRKRSPSRAFRVR